MTTTLGSSWASERSRSRSHAGLPRRGGNNLVHTPRCCTFDRNTLTLAVGLPRRGATTARPDRQRQVDSAVGKPEHKRRWQIEPWQQREKEALRNWLLERLEDRQYWFNAVGRPTPRSVGQLADEVARDPDLSSVLGLWAGNPDAPVTSTLVKLLDDQTVPFLAAHRYKESGLRKREAWEETWELQRREDRREKLDKAIPVPPKYTSADFTKASYWQHRGKLDVVPAGNAIRAAQAACSYSCSTPPRRSRRWMVRWAKRSGSVIGSGSGASGRALAMPWCGRCSL